MSLRVRYNATGLPPKLVSTIVMGESSRWGACGLGVQEHKEEVSLLENAKTLVPN